MPPSSARMPSGAGRLPCLVRTHPRCALERTNAKRFSPASVPIPRPSPSAAVRGFFCTALTGPMPARSLAS
jgi:hypothetical protein